MKLCQQCGEHVRDNHHRFCPRCDYKRHVAKFKAERSYMLIIRDADGVERDRWIVNRACPGLLEALRAKAVKLGGRCYRKDFPAVQI